MMFERKLYRTLLDWKAESNGRSALLIEGARRVGKTTLVKAFAAQEYQSSLFIDFSQVDKDVRDIFNNHRGDIDTLLRMLQLYFGVELVPRHSLVVFDEVQRFPIAREMIKHLVADGRFDYMETGSLISIRRIVKLSATSPDRPRWPS
ncbi:MAG: AAA family ATPase, partial [Atopobiaceae bacterium]